MRESLGSNMEKYICIFDGITNGLSATYNFGPKIIFANYGKHVKNYGKY